MLNDLQQPIPLPTSKARMKRQWVIIVSCITACVILLAIIGLTLLRRLQLVHAQTNEANMQQLAEVIMTFHPCFPTADNDHLLFSKNDRNSSYLLFCTNESGVINFIVNNELCRDMWGQAYIYQEDGIGITLWSLGPDRIEKTGDDVIVKRRWKHTSP
ncbi:MAG: hypothetical protein A2283_11495 [Lentisphaerae bacterium RIFOXYA12_FULL_48_11]|nr:MAG: hypothetical protein A2283_11495 [Lentisphaerae bacterium RIFOXYA12_FULL_48_11]